MADHTLIAKITGAIIGIVILVFVVAELVPEVNAAGDSLNATGAPLASLFASNGVVTLIVVAIPLLVIVGLLFLGMRTKGK